MAAYFSHGWNAAGEMGTEILYGSGGLFLQQARPPTLARWQLSGDHMTIGRDPSSTIRVDGKGVSRCHAYLERQGLSWSIADAGSTNGTFVNGRRVAQAVLRAHDRISVGLVELEVLESGPAPPGGQPGAGAREAEGPWTAPLEPFGAPAHAGPAGPALGPGPGPAGIDIDQVDAGRDAYISGRDQYVSYVQEVRQQHDSFLAEVAATKTRARWLIWTGFLTFVAGFGLFAYADLSLIKRITDSFQSSSPPDLQNPLGREIAGVPLGLIGWVLGAVGGLLLIVGIVLHIIATSRRRQAEEKFRVLPPWEFTASTGRQRHERPRHERPED